MLTNEQQIKNSEWNKREFKQLIEGIPKLKREPRNRIE